MVNVTSSWLQSTEALHTVPPDQLQWLIDNSRHYELGEGEYLFTTGLPITGTHIIINGRISLLLNQNKGIREMGSLGAHDITGHLPFSRGTVATVSGLVIEPMQVLTFPIEKMRELITTQFELTQALVHVMTSRVRDFTALQQQNEKMMALGKLSAGLAHELNNPAAAIVRGSSSLLKHLKMAPETFKKVISIKMPNEDVDKVNNKLFEVLARKDKPVLTLMTRSALEDDFTECLEGHGVDNGQEVAETFIEFGFTCKDMDEMAAMIPAAYLSPVLNWINNELVTEKMVNDIQEASQRIQTLVGAVKNFTHMDRDQGKEFVDIHAGITNTLTMLAHKIRKGNVELVETYDTSVPHVMAYVGELNQVWTNIFDNALDSMEVNGKGRLEITTKWNKKFVQVSVTDDGPGIPEEIRSRIFDPFFTTKEIGRGTGLGLDVVNRIIRQHHGTITVDSQPGRTEFTLCFPLEGMPAAVGNPQSALIRQVGP